MFELDQDAIEMVEASEMAVIGSLLLDNSKLTDTLAKISSDDFYNYQPRVVFRAIEILYEKECPVDPLSVSNKLSDLGLLVDVGGLQFLAQTAQDTPSSKNIGAYATKVSEASKKRQIDAQLVLARNALNELDVEAEDQILNAISISSNIGQDESDESELEYREQCKLTVKLFEQRMKTKGMTGVATGFNELDDRFNGLQPTDLVIVAGRPAMGKTTLALNIIKHAAEKKHCLMFSMEMGFEQIIEKSWSSFGVPLDIIKRGDADQDDGNLQIALGRAMKLDMTIDDRGGLTPQQVRHKCLKVKRKHDLGLVVIDYIQLMNVNKSNGQTDKITQISQALKSLAKELRCPVIALSQLNRGVEGRPNKRPLMSDLRDSGAIEQDADIIMFCYRDDYYAQMEHRQSVAKNIAEIITAKYRGGEVGTDYLGVEFHYQRFTNLKEKYTPVEIDNKSKAGRTQF